jgi:hypothetical protein
MNNIAILCSGGDDISQRKEKRFSFLESKVVSIKTIVARGENGYE